MSIISSGLRFGIFAAAAGAVVKGAWKYVQIVRHDNRTTKANELLNTPDLEAARTRSRESYAKVGIKTDATL